MAITVTEETKKTIQLAGDTSPAIVAMTGGQIDFTGPPRSPPPPPCRAAHHHLATHRSSCRIECKYSYLRSHYK
ncbi:hypothetical protein J6590_066095 [Homalodisca vitripennis]|nr:hypothetical protein J6590_066095 [Homalodisca vitripennis]